MLCLYLQTTDMPQPVQLVAPTGTEFNPALYKQSMLALADCDRQVKSLQEKPRVFFMDANIKHFSTLCPFTHVYVSPC